MVKGITEQEMLELMGDAIQKHGEVFDIMNEINSIMSSNDKLFKKWMFFLDNNIPIVLDQKTRDEVTSNLDKLHKQAERLGDYLKDQIYLEPTIRSILHRYICEVLEYLNDTSSTYARVVNKSFFI